MDGRVAFLMFMSALFSALSALFMSLALLTRMSHG